MGKRYMLHDEYGHEKDVTLEVQGYLEKIASLEKELTNLGKRLAEKPKERTVKKHEWE